MSIIRQRRRNLIISWLFGFMIALFILTIVSYLYRYELAGLLRIEADIEAPVVEEIWVIVAAKPLQEGSIIAGDDLKTIPIKKDNHVHIYYTSVDELIGLKTKIDIDENMPMTPPLFQETIVTNDALRLYEVSFVELPYLLSEEDIVDVRIAFPTGQEFVVLSKKKVQAYERTLSNVHKGLLNIALDESEALRMSSALVDMYMAKGARIYLAKYLDASQQAASLVTYPVNQHVLQVMKENPAILTSFDPISILEARQGISSALMAMLDENQDPIYEVNMATPDMNVNGSSQEETQEVESSQQVAPAGDENQSDTSNGIGF